MFLSPLFRKAVLCCLPLLLPGSMASAQGLFVTNGGEYSISGPLPGDQVHPSLAINANGGFLVFEDNCVDTSGQGISALALDSNFSPVGTPFRVNQTRSGDQEHPQAVLLSNGGTAFVWQSRPLRSARHIFARFLSASNTWVTGDILVNSSTKDSQISPAIAALPNGNVVIVYASFNQAAPGSMQDVYAQIFSPAGQRVGGEFLVNQFTTYNQRTPAVAALGSGGFVILWVSEQQRIDRVVDIYGRLFDAAGAPQGDEFRVTTSDSDVAANPSVAGSTDGGFIAAWSELDSESLTNGWDVLARQFSASASGGNVLQLNSYTFGNQYAPRVAALSSGALALWESMGQDGSGEGVFGRVLDPAGALSGPEFRVNTTVAGPQKFATVTADGSARIVATWSAFTHIHSGFDLYAQLYATPGYVAGVASTNFLAPAADPFPTDNLGHGGNGNGGTPAPPGGSSSGTNSLPKGLAAATGVYYGEFYVTDGIDSTSAGSFTATINAKNSFSAKLVLGGKTYSVSGKLASDGTVTTAIKRTTLTLQFTLDLNGGNRIDGSISSGGWSAELHALKLTFNKRAPVAAGFSGSYTLRIPADPDSATGPAGDGFASVKVDAGGKLQLSGSLADGTKISQRVGISQNGDWPVFVSLYGGRGSLVGWLQITNGSISKMVVWTKPAGAKSKSYLGGFTNVVDASGHTINSARLRTLNWPGSSGKLVLSAGGLNDSVTNSVALGLNNRLTGPVASKLRVSISARTGLFTGSILNPAGRKSLRLQGAVDESSNTGFGYFLNGTSSGLIQIEEAP